MIAKSSNPNQMKLAEADLYEKEEYLNSSQDKGDGEEEEEEQSQPFFSTKTERDAEADFTKDG